MQMNEKSLISIVELAMEKKEEHIQVLNNELDFFFENVMDTVVEYFELEKVQTKISKKIFSIFMRLKIYPEPAIVRLYYFLQMYFES